MSVYSLMKLYDELLVHVDYLVDIGSIGVTAGDSIKRELFDARWCSKTTEEADQCLRALAFHHCLPTPEPDNAPFDLDKLLNQEDYADDTE